MNRGAEMTVTVSELLSQRTSLSMHMGTHGLRFLRNFLANLRFFQEDLRFSD